MKSRIAESKKTSEKIQLIASRRSYDLDDRKTVVVGNFSVSLEYHKSLSLLFENNLYGAGTALLRAQFESYVKGLWFLNCSTDVQIDRAYNDAFKKEFQQLITGLEHVQASGWEDIKTIKEKYWGVMNGFTHSAKPQLARRFKGNKIAPNYDEGLLSSALNLSDFIAIRTVIELSDISNQGIPENQLHELITLNKSMGKMFNHGKNL